MRMSAGTAKAGVQPWLAFHEAVVRQAVGKLLAHMVAHVTEVERL